MSYQDDDDNASDNSSDDNAVDDPMEEDMDDGDGDGDDGDGDVDMDDGDDEGDDQDDDDQDGEGDGDGDGEGEGDEGDDDDDDDADHPESPTLTRMHARSHGTNRARGGSLMRDKPDLRSPTKPSTSSLSPLMPTDATGLPVPLRPSVRPEALVTETYDILPTMAAPQGTSINAIAATPDMHWVFTGGSDGYIRKYNWLDTVNGKLMLTVAQRHPFVDSVMKAGVLHSYWENEDITADTPTKNPDDGVPVSPVYALAVQYQSLWLLSGDETGAITLQSVRHGEGNRIATLRRHTSAVSVLTLSPDERSCLSGSWDKNICDWDLNTGQVRREFSGNGGQISAIELRPLSSVPVPANDAPADELVPNGTFFANTGAFARSSHQTSSHAMARTDSATDSHSGDALTPRHNDDDDLLLGDRSGGHGDGPDGDGDGGGGDGGGGGFDNDEDLDSLFGDDSAPPALRGLGAGGDDDVDDGLDELSRAIATDLRRPGGHDDDDMHHHDDPATGMPGRMQPAAGPDTPTADSQETRTADDGTAHDGMSSPPVRRAPVPKTTSAAADAMAAAAATGANGTTNGTAGSSTNPADAPLRTPGPTLALPPGPDPGQTSPTTFLSASIDGTIRIWDLRAPRPATSFPSTPSSSAHGHVPTTSLSASLRASRNAPPWCMSAVWSPSGNAVYAGRRNSCVDEYLLHAASASAARALAARLPARVFRFPGASKAVSALRPFPNGRHLMCASHDILRLYDVTADSGGQEGGAHASSGGARVPFLIVPGHRSGVVSHLYLDPSCKFLLSAAGNRGWEEASTEVLLGYEIGVPGYPLEATPAAVVAP